MGRPATDGDPVCQIICHVHRLDPALAEDELAALIVEAVPLPAQQQRLAWDLDDNPALLTGDGAQGSPRLLALLGALVAHGAEGVTLPVCPLCGAQRQLGWLRDGIRCCRRCCEQPRTEQCSQCSDTCAQCGQTKPVHGCAPDGPLCRSCFEVHPLSLRHCNECGTFERLYHHGLCTRCACLRMLRDLLSDSTGALRPAVVPIVDALATSVPSSVPLRLREAPPRHVLTAIAAADGPVTHALLDGLDHPQAVTRLRATLVAHRVLPDRDEHLAAIERWLGPFLDRIDDHALSAKWCAALSPGITCGGYAADSLSTAAHSSKPW